MVCRAHLLYLDLHAPIRTSIGGLGGSQLKDRIQNTDNRRRRKTEDRIPNTEEDRIPNTEEDRRLKTEMDGSLFIRSLIRSFTTQARNQPWHATVTTFNTTLE